MSRLIALYRTAARYRLDQLLPSAQRPAFAGAAAAPFSRHVSRQ